MKKQINELNNHTVVNAYDVNLGRQQEVKLCTSKDDKRLMSS